MLKLLFCLLAGVVANEEDLRWQNSYDQPLQFFCPYRQTISYIRSIHDNYYEDRMWDFGCQDTFSSDTECSWSDYVNNFDQEFSYQCPYNGVLSGMSSYHSSKEEDRRWKFYCCRVSHVCNDQCQWTPYVNYFDEELTFQVPYEHHLVGAESFHNNHQEDRRWKYYHCSRKSC